MLLVALSLLAHAEPWDDPAASTVADEVRAQSIDHFLGAAPVDYFDYARRYPALAPGSDLLAPEQAFLADGGRARWVVRGRVGVDAGTLDPVNAGGRDAPGITTGTVAVDGRLYAGPLVVVVRPAVQGAVAPGSASVYAEELWAAVGSRGAQAGFGARPRWYGPAHHSTLTLSDNASPPWMGWIAGEGRWKGKAAVLGRFRAELDVGVLDRPRTDVVRPGFLALDLRWLPWTCVEIGATRMSVFGGVDRPPVDIGQLLLPTEPHVYDDPDLSEADQNELAALDFRVTFPLRRWWGLPVDSLEGWWQYGGEDVIGRKSGGIPYPSLAGVANIYGAAVAVGPVRVELEYARLMDDYFRWYIGHRVYHEGFTQAGRPMGQFGGTDSENLWGAVRWEGDGLRLRVSAERLRRVNVIEALNDKLFAFSTDEEHVRVGVAGGRALPRSGWVDAEVEVDAVRGVDFVPDTSRVAWRASVTVTPGAWSGSFGGRDRP